MLHSQRLQGPRPFQNPVIIAHILSADSIVKAHNSGVLVSTQEVLDKC